MKTSSQLHELGLSYEEAVKVMSRVTKDAQFVKRLWGRPNAGQVKPRLSSRNLPSAHDGNQKTLGTILITAALIKERRSSTRVVDAYNAFRDVTRELQKIERELV